jgi:prepilin-type N-terminal cleavage/methylation domain-containing protein
MRPRGDGRRGGFTLIELLVVLSIMALLMGLVTWNYPRNDQRRQSVKAAAEELAATCRQARAMALSRNATYAVVFNIQNDPASSGRMLNNRSGGHWYRIVGPSSSLGSYVGGSRDLMQPDRVENIPSVVGSLNGNVIISSPYTLFQTAEGMERAWAAEAHTLPAGKVRFLALTDMDYGDYTTTSTRRVPSAAISYPRPWFGWWDKDNQAGGGAGRLYPWGGYDPAIPGSGFYYWGPAAAPAYAPLDVKPVNSTNAATRTLDRWVDGQQAENSSGSASNEVAAFPAADVLYAAGTPRPVVNGSWRDMSIVFCASGEVRWGGTMPGRHCTRFQNGTVSGTPVFRGAAERCNGVFNNTGIVNQHYQAETGTFEKDSGGFLITLAPDLANDQDVFSSAEAVQKALMPLYRVFVSVQGEVRVIPVSLKPSVTALAPFPTSESWYRSGTNMRLYFGQDRLVKGNRLDSFTTGIGDVEPGGPITDFLTADMLKNRAIWLK